MKHRDELPTLNNAVHQNRTSRWVSYACYHNIVTSHIASTNTSQDVVEASIADLSTVLSDGCITSVELVAKYLLRVFTYDCRGPFLNSIPILNPDAFDEAAASDARRRAGHSLGLLDGIPYTIKDSMKYKGMTCATGSPAVKGLVANEDCFVAEQLRSAGAVCIGRTNTPPFMASESTFLRSQLGLVRLLLTFTGGMHRGLHGRAGSPYNLVSLILTVIYHSPGLKQR